jgi:hypothetical protein
MPGGTRRSTLLRRHRFPERGSGLDQYGVQTPFPKVQHPSTRPEGHRSVDPSASWNFIPEGMPYRKPSVSRSPRPEGLRRPVATASEDYIRRCAATFGVGPSEDLSNTCPLTSGCRHPAMLGRQPVTASRLSGPLTAPKGCLRRLLTRGSATWVTPGKPVANPPNQTTIWCLDRGRSTYPKVDSSSTVFDINQHASTPIEDLTGTFAKRSGDRPTGPITRRLPTPGSLWPTRS